MTLDTKSYSSRNQQMAFCKVAGALLAGSHTLETITVPNANQCVSLCAGNAGCMSANYIVSTGACALQKDIDEGNEADFQTNKGVDHVHFTSRECTV